MCKPNILCVSTKFGFELIDGGKKGETEKQQKQYYHHLLRLSNLLLLTYECIAR